MCGIKSCAEKWVRLCYCALEIKEKVIQQEKFLLEKSDLT